MDWLVRRVSCCAPCGTRLDVDGRLFAKVDLIATGGFSQVFLVRELGGSGRRYALKQMLCSEAAEVRRAGDEIRLHRQLLHVPQVLRLEAAQLGDDSVGASTSDKQLVYRVADASASELSECAVARLVFPYMKRGSLHDELAERHVKGDHVPLQRLLRLFLGVLQAVLAMHRLRPPVAHRDIKPHNVLLSGADEPLLMDLAEARQTFDTAAAAAAARDRAAQMCSMCYRPPELFHIDAGDSITESTDVWSLGCLLYAMCFFCSPFDKGLVGTWSPCPAQCHIMSQVYERGDSVPLAVQNKVPLPEHSPYPAELHDLIASMLQVQPELRPSVEQIIDAVQRLGNREG